MEKKTEYIGYLKNNKSILGGFLGDRDKRTKRAFNSFLLFLLASFLTVVGVFSFFYQHEEYNKYLINNTTPIGTELKFSRSGANVYIGDVWTDQDREVTVVKIKYSKNAYQILSTNGVNYNIYVASKKKDEPKNIKVSYGMLSTDGDGFLFIKGKLDERAYQIFLANQLNLVTTSNIDDIDDNEIKKNDSITKSLSQYSMNTVDKKGILYFKDDVRTATADNINFRINPFSKTTNVYQGTFLDEKGELDYSKIVSITSTKSIVDKLQQKIKTNQDTANQIDSTVKEFRERLEINPNDSNSIENIKQLETKKTEVIATIEETQTILEMYETANFTDKSFGKMNHEYSFLPLD